MEMAAIAKTNEPLLQINGLKTYFYTKKGIVKAVDEVDIAIPRGKTVGLVGESGCGKSMTAMSVMGLVDPPGKIVGGEIRLGSLDLIHLTDKERRSLLGNRVSMVFQEPMSSLNPIETVGDQVAESLLLHQQISKTQAYEKTLEIFRQGGIPDAQKRLKSYPYQLSGGLRQRVMIGMAIACDPDLLIADEPTTALDVTIEAQILQLLRDLQKRRGTSILMITHNLGVVAELCDFVYVMYAGKVVEYADVYELFRNPLHPYTQGLLHSLPAIGAPEKKLYNIRGTVPNLYGLPRQCRFLSRCDRAAGLCAQRDNPPLTNYGDNHWVRCYRVGEPLPAGGFDS